MTYNLEDFEKWLNEDKSRKRENEWGIFEWERIIKDLKAVQTQKERANIKEDILEWFLSEDFDKTRKEIPWIRINYFYYLGNPSPILAKYRKVILEWIAEEDNKNMINYLKEFKSWLNEDEDRKKGLPEWDEILAFFEKREHNNRGENLIDPLFLFVNNFEDSISEYDKIKKTRNLFPVFYRSVIREWQLEVICIKCDEMADKFEEENKELEEKLKQKETELTTELKQLKQDKVELESKLNDQETTLTNLRQQLDHLKSELSKKQQEQQDLEQKLTTEQTKSNKIEQQLTALAISSGLLSKQAEDLTNQLSESEQKEQAAKLEIEIKDNLLKQQAQLLKDKDNKISQQTAQIQSLQNLGRQNDEQLKKCQEIIQQKTEQLTKLELEKENIQQELDQAQEKLKELEQTLLNSQNKILELEARIKELENNHTDSEELERLKKELAEEKQTNQQQKTKSQSEINKLKAKLIQAKLKEEQLSQKIKELSKKPAQAQTIQTQKSFWQMIKIPLFYIGGIILVIMVVGWLYSQSQE